MFGLYGKSHQFSHSPLTSSIAARKAGVEAPKEKQRAQEKSDTKQSRIDKLDRTAPNSAADAPAKAKNDDAVRFAEKLTGAKETSAIEKNEPLSQAADATAPENKESSAGNGRTVRAESGSHPWGQVASEKASVASQTPSIREQIFEAPELNDDLARIVANAEAMQRLMLAKSLIDDLAEFASTIAEDNSRGHAQHPNANMVADAYRSSEPQSGTVSAHA